MFGCMYVTIHGSPKYTAPLHFFFVRIRHYSKGNNIVWKKGRKSYEGMRFKIRAYLIWTVVKKPYSVSWVEVSINLL